MKVILLTLYKEENSVDWAEFTDIDVLSKYLGFIVSVSSWLWLLQFALLVD